MESGARASLYALGSAAQPPQRCVIPKRLLVLAVYPEDQAGTRLRGHQFAPYLSAGGIDVEYWSFLSESDSRRWFAGPSRWSRVAILLRSTLRLVRLPGALRRADVALVLREAIPVATACIERLAARRMPVVWDVDDAIWATYPRLFLPWLPERLRRSETKYVDLARLAREVWAGSETLAEWCRQWTDAVLVVPTVVDVSSAPIATGSSRTVTWVGSASTSEFLERILPALGDIDPRISLDCVGAAPIGAEGFEVRQRPWSLTAESESLAGGRVGVYPIDLDHPLGPGKAGLKAVLYMAHGLPSVVTPTTAVASLVRHGVEGFHATTREDWRHYVSQLLDDDDLWRQMSQASRARAEAAFSLDVWGPRVQHRIAALAEETD